MRNPSIPPTRRIGLGGAVTLLGAVLVVTSLFAPWYHVDRATNNELTGWEVFTHLRVWLVIASVLAAATLVLPRGRAAVATRAALGLLAGTPIFRRVLDPPEGPPVDHRAGVIIALVGATAIVAGGLLSFGRAVAEARGWQVPGAGAKALPGPPSAPSSPTSGAAATPVADDGHIVDAEVVEMTPRHG